MGAAQPRKGKGYEREIVKLLLKHGFEAERARGSDGRSIGEIKECDVRWYIGARKMLSQLFRPGKVAKKYIPPQGIDNVIFRQDRGEDLIMIRLKDLFELIAGQQ